MTSTSAAIADVADAEEAVELARADWRHNAALAIRLSRLQQWPPRAGVAHQLSLPALAAFAHALDLDDATWEEDPLACFDERCPDDRAEWLWRRLLADA